MTGKPKAADSTKPATNTPAKAVKHAVAHGKSIYHGGKTIEGGRDVKEAGQAIDPTMFSPERLAELVKRGTIVELAD